jgi:hypothetical protein
MPTQNARKRAATKKRQGKSSSSQAGEYVREEMRHAKQGKHSSKNRKQAIAIGLSKARQEGVKVKPAKKGAAKKKSAAKKSAARKSTAKKSSSRGRKSSS